MFFQRSALALNMTLEIKECLSVRTLFLLGFKFLRISFIVTNFQVFSLGEKVSSSKHLEAQPRQMQLGMRSLQASLVSAGLSGCDVSFNKLSSFPAVDCTSQV